MKKNLFFKKAFSMIEMSVVILIIGLIIAAMTGGSIIINKMTLRGAQELTQNSPVNSTPDLILWLEPTLPESFLAAEMMDGNNITKWNDINPQLTIKNSVSRVTSNSNIVYEATAINNIPALYFNGTSGVDNVLTGNVLIPKGNVFTLFIVAQLFDPTVATSRSPFYNGNASGTGFGYLKYTTLQRSSMFGGVAMNLTGTTALTSKPEVIMINCCNTTVAMQVNSTVQTISSPAGGYGSPPSVNLYVGNSGSAESWLGYVSEIIVFERILTATEITAITQYLGKKYKIKVS